MQTFSSASYLNSRCTSDLYNDHTELKSIRASFPQHDNLYFNKCLTQRVLLWWLNLSKEINEEVYELADSLFQLHWIYIRFNKTLLGMTAQHPLQTKFN